MGRFTPILVLCLFAPEFVLGQSFVIGTKSADGKVVFEGVEDFQIGQGKKIKFLPEQAKTVDGNSVKRLEKAEISQAGVIRNDGSGRVIRVKNGGKDRDVVLPESFTVKTPTQASSVPGRLALTIVRSKKAKQTDELAPEVFFVCLYGPSPDQTVLQFLFEDWAFLNQAEQLATMEGFVASFKDSPAVGSFRNLMERKLADGLGAFEDGGLDKNLRALQPFAVMARKAFSGYAPIEDLNKRIFERVSFIDNRIRLIKSLAALGDWDELLAQYKEFERYQRSFEEVIALRTEALEESARMHARRAKGFALRKDHDAAIREASFALLRDPNNKETRKVLDGEKVLGSQIEAGLNEGRRKVLPKGSPQEAQFRQYLSFADRAIGDKDFPKTEENIREAEGLNPGAPEILLRKAKLKQAQQLLSEALPILDDYFKQVVDPVERQKGEEIRNDILYDRDKKTADTRREADVYLKNGQYSKLNELLKIALNLDPHDPYFQFYGGTTAAALHETENAKRLLQNYLDGSNSLDGDLKKRDQAGRVLAIVSSSKPPQPGVGQPNWFSGRKLTEGIYYCPESLAFQIPIESVIGNKVRIAFNWEKGRLDSIQATWEDEKGAQNYRALASRADSEAAAQPAGGEDFGSFHFQYFASGQLLSVRSKRVAQGAEPKEFNVRVARDDKGRARLVDNDGYPQVVIPSNRYADTDVLGFLEGPVATIVSGSPVFNPFLWDGIHYFSVRYDAMGRATSAEEWNADNIVRFAWENDRLTEIRAYHKGSETPYYQRSIKYAGLLISAEDFSMNGRSGHIKYTYVGKTLTQIKIEDGREWTAKPRS
jgi:tetratricopeptide (TPR) repeat protein